MRLQEIHRLLVKLRRVLQGAKDMQSLDDAIAAARLTGQPSVFLYQPEEAEPTEAEMTKDGKRVAAALRTSRDSGRPSEGIASGGIQW